MQQILQIFNSVEGFRRITCNMDNILVWESNQTEHDEQLKITLRRLQQTGITLNKQKYMFNVKTIKFLGHIIDELNTSRRRKDCSHAQLQNSNK